MLPLLYFRKVLLDLRKKEKIVKFNDIHCLGLFFRTYLDFIDQSLVLCLPNTVDLLENCDNFIEFYWESICSKHQIDRAQHNYQQAVVLNNLRSIEHDVLHCLFHI